ncbi:MAG: hypothetical protein KDA17_07090 [Candidatus Saccharibacteria bacterium]|nr:hypothetical protein [Candidatus Saccharibacteria bacterium]
MNGYALGDFYLSFRRVKAGWRWEITEWVSEDVVANGAHSDEATAYRDALHALSRATMTKKHAPKGDNE